MNEPPTEPMTPVPPTPPSSPASAAADDEHPDTPTRTRRRTRALLIGTGAAAVLLLGGAGAAIGLSSGQTNSAGPAVPIEESPRAEHNTPGAGNATPSAAPHASGPATSTTSATSEAASIAAAIATAVQAAGGTGATEIEREHSGWEVEVALPNGLEAEVFVAADGTPHVTDAGDPDDRVEDPLLETSALPDIIAAAITAAGGGEIESISTDDDRVRYEVHIDVGAAEDIEVELDRSLSVLKIDRD